MGSSEGMHGLLHTSHWPEPRRFLKFVAVGGCGFVINAVLLKVLADSYHWNPAFANLAGAGAAIFSTFNLNNLWTFQKEKTRGAVAYFEKLLEFYGASAFGVIVIQTGAILLGTRLVGDSVIHLAGFGMHSYLLYFVVGTCLMAAWNFSVYSRIIWRKSQTAPPVT